MYPELFLHLWSIFVAILINLKADVTQRVWGHFIVSHQALELNTRVWGNIFFMIVTRVWTEMAEDTELSVTSRHLIERWTPV